MSDRGTSRNAAQRSVYLDALRAVALIRVVLYHTSGSWKVTAFTAMPLMFFIAGTLYAASLERRPARLVIRDRYRRILVPYWLYIVAMVGLWAGLGVVSQINPVNWIGFLFPVLSLNGPKGPGPGTVLHLTWFTLWYIQMHLVLSLVGRPLRTAQQRTPRILWSALLTVFVLSAVLAPPLAIATFYAASWILGYYHFDGLVERWLRPRWVATCAATGPLGAVLFFGFFTRAPVVAAFGVAFLGAFWLCLAIGLQPVVEPWLTARRARSVITWFSQRSLTIYLWHGAVLWMVLDLGLPGFRALPIRLVWVAALLVVAVAVVGWAEDVAARRPVQLWPRLPSARHRDGPTPVLDLRADAAAPQRADEPGVDLT